MSNAFPVTRAARLHLASSILGTRTYGANLDEPTKVTFRLSYETSDDCSEMTREAAGRLATTGFRGTSYTGARQSAGTWYESYITVDLELAE